MYSHFKSMLEVCQQHDWPLWKAICAEETELTGKSEENTFERMELRYQIMRRSAEIALENPLPGHTGAPTLITGSAHAHNSYAASGCTLCGPILNKVMARALSCSEANASMGRVCAMPTAGSCGIVPAVMVTLEEELQLPRRKVLEALIIASGVGSVITQNATVSGAEGGCQAECGAAAAMAAAAAVYLKGGTPDQSLSAASHALINVMGLVCDPIAGLVQVPCAQRNASQAINALVSADLALAGMPVLIPHDEVLEAMYRTGKSLPSTLRETALGGIAGTRTGQEIARRVHDS
ncbi:MAG: L-serine ammonia-lyase, iron-sulfur-dependent, subunit alpha [Oscillospiraceae bacterium]|nr:L-serine ammonia-lyase, iron-sulfur-dependent, subunit alpha [Oscillospiraceae bacterium]